MLCTMRSGELPACQPEPGFDTLGSALCLDDGSCGWLAYNMRQITAKFHRAHTGEVRGARVAVNFNASSLMGAEAYSLPRAA